jgi:hypothetical protein
MGFSQKDSKKLSLWLIPLLTHYKQDITHKESVPLLVFSRTLFYQGFLEVVLSQFNKCRKRFIGINNCLMLFRGKHRLAKTPGFPFNHHTKMYVGIINI